MTGIRRYKQEIYIYKILVDSNFTFTSLTVMHDYVCFIAPKTTVIVDDNFCENCSHFMLK